MENSHVPLAFDTMPSSSPPCLCKLFFTCPQQPLICWTLLTSLFTISSSKDSFRSWFSFLRRVSRNQTHAYPSPKFILFFMMALFSPILKSWCLFSLIFFLVNTGDKQQLSRTYWHLCVYYSTIHSIHWYGDNLSLHWGWVSKETLVHLYNRIVFIHKVG